MQQVEVTMTQVTVKKVTIEVTENIPMEALRQQAVAAWERYDGLPGATPVVTNIRMVTQ